MVPWNLGIVPSNHTLISGYSSLKPYPEIRVWYPKISVWYGSYVTNSLRCGSATLTAFSSIISNVWKCFNLLKGQKSFFAHSASYCVSFQADTIITFLHTTANTLKSLELTYTQVWYCDASLALSSQAHLISSLKK